MSQIEVLDQIPREEIAIIDGCVKKYNEPPKKMLAEDICAMDKLTEEKISDFLKERLEKGDSYSFVGDVLVSLNSNDLPSEYPRTVSILFFFKNLSLLFILSLLFFKKIERLFTVS